MPTAVLEARELTKRYGALTAVEALTLEVCEGEVFGLLGPNGAGKTTLINMLCGLLKPDAGQVLIHGKTVTDGDASLRSLRSRVGVCPQNITLWNTLTCLEQMQFIGEMYGLKGKSACERSRQLLRELDLEEKKDSLARTLSGGMQRRLNLARPAWTRRAACWCANISGRWHTARPSSLPPTTWTKPTAWPTGSPSSTTGNC
jgi:ABC-2 type transport system ATP-binding protein